MSPDELKQIRKSLHLTQTELADVLQVSMRAVQMWEAGKRGISPLVAKAIKALVREEKRDVGQLKEPVKPYKKTKTVPLFDVDTNNVGTAFYEHLDEQPRSYINIDAYKDCDFALTMYGQNMSPDIEGGDLLLCRSMPDLSYFNYGLVYLVVTEQETMVKQIKKGPRSDFIELLSFNPEFESFPFPTNKIKKLYAVKGVIKRHII